ncbi:tetratricopeptide repeat protein [Candidatus Calescamantes bacterium]|nr:tetratricopeptide repeat protein [Candidatus Calescamantes bacterium]
MKRGILIVTLFLVLTAVSSNSLRIMEIGEEIFLRTSEDTQSAIVLGEQSYGLFVYPGDIIDTGDSGSAIIGTEEAYFEVFSTSELCIKNEGILLKKGRIYLVNFNLGFEAGEEFHDLSSICGFIFFANNGHKLLEITDGEVKLHGKDHKKGATVDLDETSGSIAVPGTPEGGVAQPVEEMELVVEELPVPTEIKKEKKKDLLTTEEKNKINQKALAKAQAKEFKEAIKILLDGLKKSPQETSFLNNIGVMHHQLGEYDKALAAYKKVLKYDPTDPSAHYNIMCIYSVNEEEADLLLWYRAAEKVFTDKYFESMATDPDLEYLRTLLEDAQED